MAKRSKSRSAARLAAVQALYQLDMEKPSIARLLAEFLDHRLGAEIEDAQDQERYADAEVDFFDDIVSGVDARRSEIDEIIDGKLGEQWKMSRLDKTMLQILRAGTYEMIARADVPTASVITEYVDVAHAFFDDKDAKFVNGLLDAVAREKRV